MEILMNVLAILTSKVTWVVFLMIIAAGAMVYFFFKRPEENQGEERAPTSEDLRQELNEERQKQGLQEMPAINSRSGGNSYARMDNSFKSVPDFFRKLFSGKRNKE